MINGKEGRVDFRKTLCKTIREVEKINIIFMITTRIEPPLLTGSFDTVVTVDTKANMLMAANIWGYDLPKSWRKDEIARSMAYGLKHAISIPT